MENENKFNVEGQEKSMTIGCPSLGFPRFPSGADGTEPSTLNPQLSTLNPQPSTLNPQPSTLNRTDYEAIIADLFHKCNEAFINAPQRREVRPGYFRLIVGDIVDALASVVPTDHRKCEVPSAKCEGCNEGRACRSATAADGTEAVPPVEENAVYRTPQPIVDFCQSEMQRMEARKNRKIHWKTYETKVDVADMGKTGQNGKVYEIRVMKRTDPKMDTDFYCAVNGTTVLEGTFVGSAWTAKRILECALQGLVNMKARRSRQRRLAEKRRAGILTPEQELAETVRRQKEEN